MHIHVVKRGDTLSSIAAMHDALPAFVAADNGLTLSTPLVIGQALVVRTPKTLHTVRAGETLSSIARDYDLSVRTLLRRNFFLHGRELLREGDVLAIDYADEAPLGTLGVNAYAYPYIGGELLDSVLPYLTYLTPFTYGITPTGVLAPLDDARLLERAARYGAKSLMHLSTLTPEGNFSSENAALLLQNDRAQSALLAEILQTMAKKGYYGLDVDFEYVPPELREDYAAFVCRLREALNAEGKPVVAALAPKTSAQQRGLLYEAHDYALLSKAANAVFLMTYEWGYTYGEPQAIAPLPQVRAVLDYALSVTAGENIFLGAPLYAYDWPLPYESGRTRAETLSSQAAIMRARLVGAEIEFDETARSPCYHYFDKMRREHVVWFEDARSLRAKIALAAEKGLPSGGLFFVIMAVTVLIMRMTAGKVTDRHGEGIFAYSCNIAMFAAFLLLGLFPNTVTYLLAAVLSGFGFGGLEPALQSMAVAIAPPEKRGSANSTFLCAYDIGIGIGGAIAGGLISSFGYETMFTGMSVFNLLSIMIYVLIGRNHPSSFSYRKRMAR